MLLDNIDISHETKSGIQIIRYSAESVEENIALDEELARDASRSGRKILRLWSGGPTAVVLGCSDKPDRAVYADVCEKMGINVLKRVTGGSAVLQSERVFNYTLTMPDTGRLDIHKVFILGTGMLINALSIFGIDARHKGISDVAVGDLKISGNAQARKWKAVLLHGTLLADIDYELLEAVLKHPDREPDYRKGRSHRDFIVTMRDLGVNASLPEIEDAVVEAVQNMPY